MNRARQRRLRARRNSLASLALTDPKEFEVAIRYRVESWAERIRGRADSLNSQSAHKLADQVTAEMRNLAAVAPPTSMIAAKVAKDIRHTAAAEVAKVVEPRMVRLVSWPRKGR